MLRIDRTHSVAAFVFMAVIAAIVSLRIGTDGGLAPVYAAMVGAPSVLTVAALLLRRDDADDGVIRTVLAGCAATAAVSNAWWCSGDTNDMLWMLLPDSILFVMFLTIWSSTLGIENRPKVSATLPPPVKTGNKAHRQLIALIAGAALAIITYRVLVANNLEQTSALFIGIPAVLAIAVSLMARPRSAIGTSLKATVITLLISGIFLDEGFVCIVMAAPLFLCVAVIIGALVERTRNRRSSVKAVMVLAFLPFTMEGVHPEFSFPRDERIEVTRVVTVSAEQTRQNLSLTPEFSSPLPAFFHLGFPLPTATEGEGLAVGDIRRIRFAGGEGKPGWLSLQVTEADANHVRFQATGDTSHIAHWLTWQDSEVSWREIAPGQTQVRWQLRYRRELDPAWYFGPWERFAVSLAADYLIDTAAGANQ